MSSTSSRALKAARSARNSEATAVRKQILKANHSVASEEFFSKIADSGNIFAEKLFQLEKFRKKSKTDSSTQIIRKEWNSEFEMLQRLGFQYEKDISDYLEQFVLHTTIAEGFSIPTNVNDEVKGNDVQAIVDDRMTNLSKMNAYKSGLKQQINDLKSMLKSMRRNVDKSSKDKSDIAKNGVLSAATTAVSAVFADLLVRMHIAHADEWNAMCKEESQLSRDIRDDYTQVSKSCDLFDIYVT